MNVSHAPVLLTVLAVAAVLVLWLLLRSGRVAGLEAELKRCRALLEADQAGRTTLEKELAARTERVAALQEGTAALRADLAEAEGGLKLLQERIETLLRGKAEDDAARARLAEALQQERAQAGEKLALLAAAREQMGNEFKVMAEAIMARHGQGFSRQNKEQIDGLLAPLREKLTEFQQGLLAVHGESVRERATLAEQIRALGAASATMSEETRNLTRALKGEAQVQGAWGEMILASILEKSGLREGEEYVAQESHTGEDGARHRPDVVVNLPGGEKIIIDSKVSLKAFEDYASAGAEVDRAEALQRHLVSLRTHIRTLGGKDYPMAAGSRLDYVLMFVPIEGALAAAIQADPQLTALAAEANVAIATPTTLMIALRTVANVWKVERRNKNAEEIAKRAGILYDKFVGFATDLTGLGRQLGQVQSSYDDALRKLCQGKGNLVSQAELLKSLGAKTGKTVPEALRAGPEPAGAAETLDEVSG